MQHKIIFKIGYGLLGLFFQQDTVTGWIENLFTIPGPQPVDRIDSFKSSETQPLHMRYTSFITELQRFEKRSSAITVFCRGYPYRRSKIDIRENRSLSDLIIVTAIHFLIRKTNLVAGTGISGRK